MAILVLGPTWALAACGDSSAPPPKVEPMLMEASVREGELVEVPIAIDRTDAVAVQMDVVFDPAQLELKHNLRRKIDGATKEFTVTHLTAGRARVVVFGMDLEPLPSGVVGKVPLVALKAASDVQVKVENSVVADRRGAMREHEFAGGKLMTAAKEVSHAP
jgi:hypothetical protein